MADIVERLPFPISRRLASAVEEVLGKNGREIHYTIAGVPFRLHLTPDTPMTLETAPAQKNQQDTEPEAGEQTLAGWWLRSQSSFHEGAGFRYAESRGEVKETSTFWDSENVDVWTPGELKLLKRGAAVSSVANRSVASVPDVTANSVIVGQAGAVRRYTNLDTGTATTDLYIGVGVVFTQVVATDTTWFAAGDDGKVYSGPIGSVTLTPSIWTLTGATGAPRIGWAKHRLWATFGNKLYWVDYSTPGATVALYSHPSASWQYTDIADVPGGVLFSGYGDGSSHLQRVTLDTDGAAPTMSAATTTAILPSDERAFRISSLTGSLVAVLTSRGLRIAQANTTGELVYGPLLMERETELPTTAKPSLRAAGRFWWASWGDAPEMWRIDSSVQSSDGVFPYARDMKMGAANFEDIAVRGDRPVVVTSTGGLVYRHATELEAEGFLQSGRIRYRTEELKRYQFVDVSAQPLQGAISLDVLNDADTLRRLITWDSPGVAQLATAEIPLETGPIRFMSVKLTLDRDLGDASSGPVILGIQVKALPAGKPQRIYTLPFDCFDRDIWSTGQENTDGYDGYARDRYLSVRAAEDAGGVVLLKDYRFPSPVGELCKIEEMKFVQSVQGDPTKQHGGFGGILLVTLRTLT